MSRPTRMGVSILISLILIMGVFISVHGLATLHAGRMDGRLDLTVGLTLDQSHVRTPLAVNYHSAPEKQIRYHDCDFDAGYDTND